jgi:hypothetical protein
MSASGDAANDPSVIVTRFAFGNRWQRFLCGRLWPLLEKRTIFGYLLPSTRNDLKPFGKTIWDATEFYLEHLERTTKAAKLLTLPCPVSLMGASADTNHASLSRRL